MIKSDFIFDCGFTLLCIVKTPSKMDVAPWDKHRFKREFEGFGMYSMVFVQIQ